LNVNGFQRDVDLFVYDFGSQTFMSRGTLLS